MVNPRVKVAKKEEWDELPYSIKVKVPPLGISIYSYSKAVDKLADNKTARKKKKTTETKPRRDLKAELEEKISREEPGIAGKES